MTFTMTQYISCLYGLPDEFILNLCDIMSANMVCVDKFNFIPRLKVHVGNNILSSELQLTYSQFKMRPNIITKFDQIHKHNIFPNAPEIFPFKVVYRFNALVKHFMP